jgi:hypothetical protein
MVWFMIRMIRRVMARDVYMGIIVTILSPHKHRSSPPGFILGPYTFLRTAYETDRFRSVTGEIFTFVELQALAREWNKELLPWYPKNFI